MATEYEIPKMNITLIKNIMFKGNLTVPKSRLIAGLQAMSIPDSQKLDIYSKIILGSNETNRDKRLAIAGLAKIETKKAHGILSKVLLKTEGGPELLPIVQALIHRGTKQNIKQLNKLKNSIADKIVSQQIEFASTLISYRERLGQAEFAFPLEEEILRLGPKVSDTTFKIEPATSIVIKKVMAAQKNGSFGINISEKKIFLLKCKPHDWAIALNENFDSDQNIQKIMKEPNLLGQYLMYDNLTKAFSPALAIISTPKQGKGNDTEILLKDTRGVTRYAGVAKIQTNKILFTIQTVIRPGAIPIALTGTYSDGNFLLQNSKSSTKVIFRNRPKALISV